MGMAERQLAERGERAHDAARPGGPVCGLVVGGYDLVVHRNDPGETILGRAQRVERGGWEGGYTGGRRRGTSMPAGAHSPARPPGQRCPGEREPRAWARTPESTRETLYRKIW